MFQSLSLRAKLSLSVAAVAILVMGAMTVLVAQSSFQTSQENAQAITLNSARASAQQIQNTLDKALLVARSYAQVLVGKKNFGETSRDSVNAELKNLLVENPQLIGTWTGWESNAFDGKDSQWIQKPGHDQSGRFVPYWSYEKGQATLSPLLAYDKAGDGDYYLVPKARLKESLVEPYIYSVAGVPTLMTSAAVPLIINGTFKGVAGVDIGLKEIQSEVAQIKPYETSEAFLVSNSGLWVSHPQSDLITKAAQFPFESEKILSTVRKGEELTLKGEDPKDHQDYLYTIAPVRIGKTEQPWALVIRTPTGTVMAAATHLLWQQIFISIFGVSVLIAAVFIVAHWISKSMQKMSEELSSSANEVTVAIQQLTSAGHNLSKSSADSAASLEETVASLEEMNSMVQKNSESAKLAADLSFSSKHSAQKGEKALSSLIEKMAEISQSSKKIEDIINVIDDIAFQTNLLALNASVEAARAGEQGKGFAVVAEAVRNLAQRSAVAAKDISSLIHLSVEQVQEGTSQARESGQVLKSIVESIEKVSSLNSEISRASEEQASGVNQISQAMNQLDRGVQSNAAASEEIAASSQEIDAQAQVMNEVVEKMNRDIQGRSKIQQEASVSSKWSSENSARESKRAA